MLRSFLVSVFRLASVAFRQPDFKPFSVDRGGGWYTHGKCHCRANEKDYRGNNNGEKNRN
jgi:hypothetical protein